MSTILAITLLIFAGVTLLGSGLAVSRIGKPSTPFVGGQAGFIITYCIVEILVLLLSAVQLFQAQ